MEKYGFIYIWFDKKRKMFYLGSHWGTEDDGYICSSNRMRDAYRRRSEDFKRKILEKVLDRNILLETEHKWLSMISEEELGKKYYNLRKHKWGHWSADENNRLTIREKLSEASKKLHQDPVYKKKYLLGRKNLPPQTKEHIEKRAAGNRGKKRSEEFKRLLSEINSGENHPNYGKTLSEETKQKLRERMLGEKNPFYGKKHPEGKMKEVGKKISATLKGRLPKNIELFSKAFWWTDGTFNKKSFECPGTNWIRGRTMNKNTGKEN
jgi:hypothetical protein